MLHLSSIPFLRLTVCLCTGIFISLFGIANTLPTEIPVAIGVFICAAIVFSFIPAKIHAPKLLKNLLFQLAVAAYGFMLGYFSLVGLNNDFFYGNQKIKQSKTLLLRLDEELAEKQNTWRSAASVLARFDSCGNTVRVSGKLLVYWPKRTNTSKPEIQYGDEIIVPNLAMDMPSAAFPEDFDFKAVMRYKNMQHQMFLPNLAWVKTGNSANKLFAIAYQSRNNLINYLHKHYSLRVAALLESLLIGFKDEVATEDLNAFAVSGTMHVMAVSGMHVGLLYLILIFLLTGKRRIRNFPVWRGLVILICLWAFAILTGLGASVLRAAIMFSILEIGRSIFKQEGNMLNSLFASAFIQLLFDPLQLIDVGFQLSYLAVLGILVFYPKLNSIWLPPGAVLRFIYQSALVSLAATIATFPVTLYFFGKFPLWFLPANIVIVPFSSLLIIASLFSMCFGWLEPIEKLLSGCVNYLSEGILATTHFFAKLPGASLTGLKPDEFSVILLYILLIFFALYWVYSQKNAKMGIIVSTFLFAAWLNISSLYKSRSSEIVCAELKGRMLLFIRQGNSARVFSNIETKSFTDSCYNFMLPYLDKNNVHELNWYLLNGKSECHGNVKINLDYPLSTIAIEERSLKLAVAWARLTPEAQKATNGLIIIQKRFSRNLYQTPNLYVLQNTFVRFSF
jgi:competence protein ComEC